MPPARALDDLTLRKSDIPAVYHSQDTTPLVLDVPESGGVLDVELVARLPGRR